MTKHSDLSGADLHEPKGAASASSGQVYVSDGAGSGTWTALTSSNVVNVESIDDLPSPASGVITLAAETVYEINGDVDIGSRRLVLSNNTVIKGVGSRDRDGITSTTTGVLLTITDVSVAIRDVYFSAASASALWDIDGTGTEGIIFREIEIVICPVIGDIDNIRSLFMDNIHIIDTSTNGVTFTGAFTECAIRSWDVDDFTGTLLDFGTATFDQLILNGNLITVPASGTFLDVAASGANLNSGKQGVIAGNEVDTSSGGTAVTGLSIADEEWVVEVNSGVLDSLRSAQGYALDNATATTFAGTGSGQEVVCDFSTNFVSDVANGFTISTAGRFTYIGLQARNFFVNANIYAVIAGGASRTYNWYIAKNGTIIASSVSQRDYDGTNSGSCSCSSLVTLATNDYVELFIRAETATTSLTADTVSISVAET